MVGRTEGPCSDTFQPKIFRLKMEYSIKSYKSVKSVKSQKSMVGRTEGPCSDSFQPKIFRLKMEYSITSYKSQKSVARKDRRSVFRHFSAENISFEIRKK